MTHSSLLAQHVLLGLAAPQKALSSAWFYDDEGSRLFQEIMALPEYYLTRVEHQLLHDYADELAERLAPEHQPLDLIELGSGDGTKTLSLCQRLHQRDVDVVYRPMDVSAHALAALSQRFEQQLPRLAVEPVLGDYFEHWPPVVAHRRQVALLLGSNLGNFEPARAVDLLRSVHARLASGGTLLLGLDLAKDPHVVLAAYNDAQGITAAFNLNLLRRLNRELGMNFDLARFSHFASYCPLQNVARSFLVSQTEQVVESRVLDRQFRFRAGETIYTEQSQKYTPASIHTLAATAGFQSSGLIMDERQWYALAVLDPVECPEAAAGERHVCSGTLVR